MSATITSLQPGEPLHVQVERQVRAAILSGQWGPGMKLPPNDAMAASFGISVFTVQTALSRLCREGILERTPRIGTFVRGRGPRLTCSGIYFGSNVWSDLESGFSKSVYRHVAEKFSAAGVKTKIWTDSRPEEDQSKPLPELMQAIKRGEIQSLVVPLANGTDIRWLKQLSIPSAIMFGDADIEGRLVLQIREALHASVKALKQQGCRKVGLITSLKVRNELLPETSDTSPSFFANFIDAVEDSGLETRNSWIRAATEYPRLLESYGYQEFNSLWSQRERPDGLVVYADIVARGVVTAALARRVRIPRDLKLVLHANDEMPYPCPFPATQMVTPISQCADGLIHIIRQKLEGNSTPAVSVPLSIQTIS